MQTPEELPQQLDGPGQSENAQQGTPDGEPPEIHDEAWRSQIDQRTGLTRGELLDMSIEDLFNLLSQQNN